MPPSLDRAAQRLPAWHFAARIGFGVLVLISSLYAVLAYMPDTYFAFIQAPFQQWLPTLMRLQPALFLGLVSLLGISLWDLRATAQDARVSVVFIITNLTMVVWMVATAPFSHLLNDSRSFILALVILFPLLWLALADLRREWKTAPWNQPGAGTLRLWPAVALGLWVGILVPGTAYLRFAFNGQPPVLETNDYTLWFWAVITHVCFFAGLISIFNLIRGVSALSPNVSAVRFLMSTLFAFVAVRLLFAKIINPAVPFGGIESGVYATAIALASVTWIAALRVMWLRGSRAAGLPPDDRQKRRIIGAGLLLSAAFALTAPAFIGVLDWNGILEKLTAVLLWVILFGLFLPVWPTRNNSARALPHAVVGIVVVGLLYVAGLWIQAHAAGTVGFKSQPVLDEAIGRHAFLDPSVQVINQVLTSERSIPCDELCEFLNQQTNIPPSAYVKPVDVGLVQDLKAVPGPKPNVFIFVIDSLRQDYVSAYNPSVDFTPELGKFAADSVVMQNAFTRYGGTTLSEPSIWTGTMLLHKHFVQPFHSLNNLEKLLDVDGYRKFVTVDTTLRVLLQPAANTIPLDQDVKTWTDIDLCATTQDFESKLDSGKSASPIFLYTQSQNVHTVSISSHASRIHPQRSYIGFDRSIASELERLDACFGGFVKFLKMRGLYDNSIIVVTADHGEALKEIGHRRHALAIHPEILRVPLIIHVPQRLLSSLYYDTSKVAFTIDVTPSVFYLLGHRPILNAQEFGRPLFTRDKAEHDSYLRDDYLVVSSYGPVYGLLSRNGQTLFVDNEVEKARQYFDLASDPRGEKNLITTDLAAKQGASLRQHVQAIADEYHFQYRSPTLLDWAMR
jgi:sulfatase-like protein